MKNFLHIGFVGLTHLGLNYLAASAEKKFKTLGIDLNSSKTNDLKKFIIEYDEPRLRNLIIKNNKSIRNRLLQIYEQCIKGSFNSMIFDYTLRKKSYKSKKLLQKMKCLIIINTFI